MSSNWKNLRRRLVHSDSANFTDIPSTHLDLKKTPAGVSKKTPKSTRTHSKMSKSKIKADLESFATSRPKNHGIVHILANDDKDLLSVIPRSVSYSSEQKRIGKYVALDCEFVGGGLNGNISLLGRLSIVNYYGYTILDTFVRPNGNVTHWRTKWSGVTYSKVANAPSFDDVQQQAASILHNKILIGHNISSDLSVLKVPHPRNAIIDTQKLSRFMAKTPGLKKLIASYLGIDIQGSSSGHNSVEDAQATMLLFRLFKEEYLAEQRCK